MSSFMGIYNCSILIILNLIGFVVALFQAIACLIDPSHVLNPGTIRQIRYSPNFIEIIDIIFSYYLFVVLLSLVNIFSIFREYNNPNLIRKRTPLSMYLGLIQIIYSSLLLTLNMILWYKNHHIPVEIMVDLIYHTLSIFSWAYPTLKMSRRPQTYVQQGLYRQDEMHTA